MERARLSSLVVIALLQLSQTEISSTLPESWYAANVISDAVYSPRPLSEIFSTEATFSSTNPIVVLPTSPSTPGAAISTSTLSTIFTSPSTISTFGTTTVRPVSETEVSVLPLSTVSSPPPIVTVSTPRPISTAAAIQLPQPPVPPQLPQFQQPPAPPSPPPIVSTPQQIQIQTASQGLPPLPQLAQFPPNYFLLYQQAPQTIQTYPPNLPQLPISSLPPVVTSNTTPPSTTTTTSTTTQAPCATSTQAVPQATQFPTFRIRMVAPSGSVTNVRINSNPTAATTTTRRPTTTRTRRRNRNNYDGCVNGCGGMRVPICASPLGVTPINPDTLKGFPSVCHMACHNSFRKNLFEKVMDGKCGRLRTRIRPVDSNNKLNKDDLNRLSYTIVQGGPGVVEFSPLSS